MSEIESILCAPPGDGTSCIKISNYSNLLLLSSWDTVRIINTSLNLQTTLTFFFSLSFFCSFTSFLILLDCKII